MNYNFEKEINALNESKHIDDKDKVFALYYNYYITIISAMEICRKSTIEECQNYLTKTMLMVINMAENTNEKNSCVSILNNFFYYILNSNIYMFSNLRQFLFILQKSIKSNFEDLEYIDKIDKNKFDFFTIASIIMIYKKHVLDMQDNMGDVYGEVEIVKFKNNVIKELSLLVSEIINNCDDIISFKYRLTEETRKILLNKLNNNEFDFLNSGKKNVNDFFEVLDENERKLFVRLAIYKISGYEQGNGLFDFKGISIKVLAEELGMSNMQCRLVHLSLIKKYEKSILGSNRGFMRSLKRNDNK